MTGFYITINEQKSIQDKKHIIDYFLHYKKFKNYKIYNFKNLKIVNFSSEKMSESNIYEDKNWFISFWGNPVFDGSLLKNVNKIVSNNLIEDPDKLVKYLDGFFLILLYNKKNENLILVTDHIGLFTCYFYKKNDSIIISSSPVSISKFNDVSLNYENCLQFVRTGCVFNNQTIYNQISLLDLASIYKINLRNNNISTHKYWDIPQVEENVSSRKMAEKLAISLKNSLNLFPKSRTIIDLTAGYDSRLLVSALLAGKNEKDQINTFVFGPGNSLEVKKVKEYAKKLQLGLLHLKLPPDWPKTFKEYVLEALFLTEGEENIFNYASILYAQKQKAFNFDYSINGIGGELYRDFWWIQEGRLKKSNPNYKKLILNRILQYEFNYNIFCEKKNIIKDKIINLFLDIFIETNKNFNKKDIYNSVLIDNIYLKQKIKNYAGRMITSSNYIINSLSPLLLKSNLEIGFMVNPKFKRNGQLVRNVITINSKEFSKLRMLNNTPSLPINFKNFYLFYPMVFDYSKKILRKIVQRTFNKTILIDTNLKHDQSNAWNHFYEYALENGYFDFENLYSNFLYNKTEWLGFIEEARKPNFKYYEQLGNMLTLEMRLRMDSGVINNKISF